MNSGDGEVTFRVETPAFDLNPGVLDIQIFNIAGEKIRQNQLRRLGRSQPECHLGFKK